MAENPVQQQRKRGRVLAVYAGKGGVGCTTVALNLGCALASQRDIRVAIVDLDLQYGDLASAIDIAAPVSTISDLVTMPQAELNAAAVRGALLAGPGGVMILAAPIQPELADLVEANRFALGRVLEILTENFDCIVIDSGRSIGESGANALEFSDELLVVTSPDALALKNTRLAIELVGRLGVPTASVHVVLNRSESHADFEVKDVEASLKLSLAAVLPYDSRLAVRALNSGQPFVLGRPKAPLSVAIKRLAESEIPLLRGED
jgi:pilus assembly protein CpaE